MIDGGEAVRKLVLNVARYSGVAKLARPWLGGVGAILMLHRVTARPDKPKGVNRHLSISPAFLDALIGDMKAAGYDFVSMDEVVARLAAGDRGGRRFATITADDAYRDNLTEALPVFEKHGAPFTIYVAPGLINGAVDLWWDLVEDIVDARDGFYLPTATGPIPVDCSTPDGKFAANALLHEHMTGAIPEENQRTFLRDLAFAVGVDPDGPRRRSLMDWDDIRTVAAHPLATIGAHTVHHYNLRRLSEAAARREIGDVRRILEIELGRTPRHLAYPYGYAGAVGDREVAMAREAGYASAVTTRHGVLRPAHAGHLHALPRLSVNGRYQRLDHVRTMLSGVTTPLANAGRMVVTV